MRDGWMEKGEHSCVFRKQKEKEFIGVAYQGKDIVLRFIIEYSSLMDFGP
jgi:hypothetical protein